jgi:hypothetical protein
VRLLLRLHNQFVGSYCAMKIRTVALGVILEPTDFIAGIDGITPIFAKLVLLKDHLDEISKHLQDSTGHEVQTCRVCTNSFEEWMTPLLAAPDSLTLWGPGELPLLRFLQLPRWYSLLSCCLSCKEGRCVRCSPSADGGTRERRPAVPSLPRRRGRSAQCGACCGAQSGQGQPSGHHAADLRAHPERGAEHLQGAWTGLWGYVL